MGGFEPLRSPRLVLRPFRPDDGDELRAYLTYRNDAEVRRFQSQDKPQMSEEEGRDFLREMSALPLMGEEGVQIAVALADTDELVGDLYLTRHNGDERQAEVGYTITPKHQGKGYATEALGVLIDHLLGPMALHRVVASADPRNGPSLRVLERLGMRREALFIQSYWDKGAGEWVDDVVYAVLQACTLQIYQVVLCDVGLVSDGFFITVSLGSLADMTASFPR